MANDSGDFARSMSIATSGLRAQAGRMRLISENIANAEFHGADVGRRAVSPQDSDLLLRARPHARCENRRLSAGCAPTSRPSASRTSRATRQPTQGNVKYPNVNPLIEMTDMREAQRSYEANLNIISATRRMIQRTLDILKA